jgi:hypothetical protein
VPGILQRLRNKIIDRAYYLSSHAEEEMRDDRLDRDDVEHAILKGNPEKTDSRCAWSKVSARRSEQERATDPHRLSVG